MRQSFFLIGFGVVFIAVLVAESLQSTVGIYVAKPLIMLSLAGHFLQVRGMDSWPDKALFTGLFMSLAGDLFLMLPSAKDVYFIPGLAAFLVAHLCYIAALAADIDRYRLNRRRLALAILVAVVYCVLLLYRISGGLGDLGIPVALYAMVIASMAVTAASRNSMANRMSYVAVLVGACLFIVSDSAIAFNKFAEPIPAGRILIMTTYMAAQFLITTGFIAGRK